jgi:carboxyl-terminal processing protease
MRRFRPVSALVFVIVVSALVGGLLGRSALAVDDRVPAHYETFSAALAAIESTYAGTIESDRLIYGAIRGMLATLDPHSSFFDPREYAQMLERQEGRYYGLGITIASIDGDITAQSVFEESPAYRAGVRRGDIISAIAGESAKGWTTPEAQIKLRGPKGTTVRIEIKRTGYDQPIALDVTRDEVQIRTVRSSFMMDDATGYVQLRDFAENTDRELQQALRDLTAQGMRRLVLDLRRNPGGPLKQAIRVSNEFLPRGSMIVYTRGRTANAAEDHHATEDGKFTDIPIVVLTNRSSASAAEIVAGALQDHDRAYIVGETTFGKALVQSVYPISGGAGLALTTAHYYTPSGRLIQRPWDASFEEYLSYSTQNQDPNKPHNPSDLKRTDAGRPVYSGGGIEPDTHVVGDTDGFSPTPFGRTLWARQTFDNFAQRFMAEGDTRIAQESTGRRRIAPDFTVDDAVVADYREFLKSDRIRIDEDAFQKDLAFIKAMLHSRIAEAVFSIAEAQQHLISVDPQAKVAMTMFGEAEKLSGLARAARAAN